MMSMTKLLPAAPAVALLLAGTAHAETRVSAVAGVDAGYATNPYLGTTNDLSSASVSVSLAPTISLVGPTSTIDLTGRVDRTIFARRYDDTTNWSLGSAAAFSLSPRSKLTLGAGFESRINTGLDTAWRLPGIPDDQAPLPDPSATDLAGQRTESWHANAGFQTALSARDTLNMSGSVVRLDYDNSGGPAYSGYTTYNGGLSLSRTFSEKLTAGFGVNYSKTDYERSFGSSRQIAPTVDATLSLAPRTSLAMSVGVSFTKVDGPNPSDKTGFYGRGSLCHRGDRSNACLTASHSTGATSRFGSSTITSVGADYSYSLTPRSSIRLGSQYSRSKSVGGGPLGETSYLNGSAAYQQQLTQRLSFSVNARYTDPTDSNVARKASFYGGVGLAYRLGR